MRWMGGMVIVALLLLSPFPDGRLSAQEGDGSESTTVYWRGDASLGFSITSGNSDTSSLGMNAKAVRNSENHKTLTLSGNYFLDTRDGEKSNNKGNGEAKYDIRLTDRFNYFSDLIASFDEFKDIDLRIVPGIGLSLLTFYGERYSFTTLAGMSAVFDRFSDGSREESATFRLGNSFNMILSENSSMEQRLDVFSNVEDPADYIIHAEASLRVAINESWSVKITAIDDFDSKPLEDGIRKNDISLFTSIAYSF